LVENRCNRCGISESVQGLHREPNLNAAVKFRMTTNKRRTILVKLWNNSTQPRWKCGVSILYNLVTWSQGRTPGNQEHTQPTPEWSDFFFAPFHPFLMMLPVLGWRSRINQLTKPHWLSSFVFFFSGLVAWEGRCPGEHIWVYWHFAFGMQRDRWLE
jgi:hypothetical protein